jgi:hypothetical protein
VRERGKGRKREGGGRGGGVPGKFVLPGSSPAAGFVVGGDSSGRLALYRLLGLTSLSLSGLGSASKVTSCSSLGATVLQEGDGLPLAVPTTGRAPRSALVRAGAPGEVRRESG